MPVNEEDLKNEIRNFAKSYENPGVKSEEFSQFKQELLPAHFNLYEKACNFCDKIVKIKINKKKEDDLFEAIQTTHLNTTPNGVTAFAIIFPIMFIFFGLVFSLIVTTVFLDEGIIFFILFFTLFGIAMIIPLSTLPKVLANNWRLKASNQMVLSIFYIVSYMRHTSNLELAIKFTSDHIAPPLAIDFKKIIWNVETSKYSSMKDSLDNYLVTWKKYNMEFVESMHLIEASLYETSEQKRVGSLEKSMSLILESTYEKMLHFAQNLKSPITMLHMLGIILPILGLVIMPLVVSFMEGVKWFHISSFYNIVLPVLVFYLGKVILSTRPTGYGQADITDVNPELKKHTYVNFKIAGQNFFSVNPAWISAIIVIIFILIGISPIIMHKLTASTEGIFDIVVTLDNDIIKISDAEDLKGNKFSLLGYRLVEGKFLGPYGLGAILLSIAFPLGLALGLSYYFRSKTQKLIFIKEKTRELENEFASALFQLGNRIGDGLPAEIAFGKVAEIMDTTISGKFFELVSSNIATLGMGVEEAIFNPKYGAITKFPSALIESSMKVFVESAKKGPTIAAQALINISTYIKEMHRVDERLKDLLAEITTSMRSQINFLAPLIAGIVIGLTSMIVTILNTLGDQISNISSDSGIPQSQTSLLALFGEKILPAYFIQIIVGIYIIQITYLLTTMLNTIQNGYDPLNEKYLLGKYLYKGGILYSAVALIVILVFNLIAAQVLPSINI